VSKQKLLLADDSITIQKVVNLTFADEGIEVIAVGDGDAAMKKFVEVTPDLVMADVNMPGIDGYRICEMIKQDDETKHIPVILLVGSFEPFDEEEARRVGANDYLTKPFQSIRQLVNKVTDLLNSSNGEVTASVEESAQSESGETAAPVYMETAAAELGDAGMDDEMIQTNQIGSLPIDEPQKFESDSAGLTAGNIPLTTLSSPYQSDFGSSTEYQTGGDFAKTQPLSTQEFHEITAACRSRKSDAVGDCCAERRNFS
jgi:CheY-like chemotaxis protein